jgi:hypothetical protein
MKLNLGLPPVRGTVGSGAAAALAAEKLRPLAPTDEDVQFWSKYGWIRIPDGPDRNLDAVWLMPEAGCPICGGVWSSLLALGFEAPRVYQGELRSSEDPAWLLLATTKPASVQLRAYEIECYSDHVFHYDVLTRKLTKAPAIPTWAISTMLFSLVGIAAYALGALGMRKP